MKKFFIFAVCALMSATASAVNFTFTEVTKVVQEGKGFVAYAGGESVAISALQYTQMKDASGWYILNVDGEKVVAAGDEFVVEPLVADSVGLDGNLPKVFFKGGTARTFQKSEWLKTLKGQTVRRIYINTPTREFENFATMEGEFACHSKTAPTKVVAPAPVAPTKVEVPKAETKVKTPKDETKVEAPKAPAKVKTPKAETKVKTPKAKTKVKTPKDETKVEAPASANGNTWGITFKKTH